MESLGYLFRYLITFILLITMYSVALIVGVFSRSATWSIIVAWERIFLKMFGVEVVFDNKNQYQYSDFSGGVVVGLTQQSLLDPFIGQAYSPTSFMSIWNIEFALIPFVGWVSWLFGWVIFRQLPSHSRKKFNKAELYLREGGIVYLSIEGKRSKNGSIGPYKKGPAVLAIQAQAKIFPVILIGSYKCLPYGEWKIRPGKVILKFLDEVSTEGMKYEDRELLIDKASKAGRA